jgi:catechol 2,3-dioxygenase-like lactoylglutathione lyase family enzyme
MTLSAAQRHVVILRDSGTNMSRPVNTIATHLARHGDRRKRQERQTAMNTVFHIGLTVSDMDRSCRFYADLFGFRVESDLKLPGERIDELLQLQPSSTIHAAYLVLGSFTLELMQFDPPSAATAGGRVFNQTGLAHLSLAVDDPEDVAARAPALGGSHVSSVAGAHVIRDPDGQLIELLPAAAIAAIRGERRRL